MNEFEQADTSYPREKDTLFTASADFRQNFKLDFTSAEFAYISSFKEAADGVVQMAVDEGRDLSFRFLAACFLYRHFIELSLKSIIRQWYDLNDKTFKPEEWQSHSLPALWNAARDAAQKYWPDKDPEVIKTVERVVNEFHQIDPTGQELRYAQRVKWTKDEVPKQPSPQWKQ